MRNCRTQFTPAVILTLGAAFALLLACSVSAQVLTIVGGGGRIIDRDPDSARTNCRGWTYAPSPAFDDAGNLIGMYTASDALTQHCAAGVGIDSTLRFGDAILFHPLREDGSWSEGANVIDRTHFDWMNDGAFLNANVQTFAGHVTSPSVVRRDGRSYMAYVVSQDDRNLCAGEHTATNACGSCVDPWSYFVIGWAVSDDGVNWRIRQRVPGDPALLGRAPLAEEKSPTSSFKGLTRVSLVADGGYFYLVAQYWTRYIIKPALFRIAYDAASEWGIAGEPEIWSVSRRAWIAAPGGRPPDFIDQTFDQSIPTLHGFLGSIVRTRVFGDERFLALSPESNRISYQTSTNLTDWTPPVALRSAIPFFADGFAYEASVIDPVAFDGADGKLHLFFASADGDADHDVARDGRHDCGIYPDLGPTAAYLGTGVYEAIVEPRVLHRTATTIAATATTHFTVRVLAFDGTTPQGNVVVSDAGGAFVIAPLVAGAASVDLPFTTFGDHRIFAWYDAQGDWDASRSPEIVQRVLPARRHAVR